MLPLSDSDVVIVAAARTPLGRRGDGLASVHPAKLLGSVKQGPIERAGAIIERLA